MKTKTTIVALLLACLTLAPLANAEGLCEGAEGGTCDISGLGEALVIGGLLVHIPTTVVPLVGLALTDSETSGMAWPIYGLVGGTVMLGLHSWLMSSMSEDQGAIVPFLVVDAAQLAWSGWRLYKAINRPEEANAPIAKFGGISLDSIGITPTAGGAMAGLKLSF